MLGLAALVVPTASAHYCTDYQSGCGDCNGGVFHWHSGVDNCFSAGPDITTAEGSDSASGETGILASPTVSSVFV